jgi:hypothetical protein
MQDRIEKVTLGSLCRVMDENEADAEGLGVRLAWGFKGSRVYGRIYKGKYLMQEKWYQGRRLPIHLAEMHDDFKRALEMMIHARRKAYQLAIETRMKQLATEALDKQKELEREQRWLARRKGS